MSAASTHRVTYADLAKGIGIILVVMEHDRFINTEHVPWQAIILSFHMPLFYFISGMFFNPAHAFRLHISKRFHSLLQPYFTVCLAFALLMLLKNHDWLVFLHDLGGTAYGTGRTLHWPYGVLWFLPSLFCTAIGYYLLFQGVLVKLKTAPARWAVLFFVLTCGYLANIWFRKNGICPDLPWSLNLLFITIFFYAAGYEFRQATATLSKRIECWLTGISVLVMGSYAGAVFSGYYVELNFFYRRYDSLWINTLEALSAIYLVLYCSRYMDRNWRHASSFFSAIGNKSLTIFMFHSFVLAYVSGAVAQSIGSNGGLRFVLTVISTIILCLIIHNILARIPVLSYLFLNIKHKSQS